MLRETIRSRPKLAAFVAMFAVACTQWWIASLEEQGAASMASYVAIAEREDRTNCESCADPTREQRRGGGRDVERNAPPSRDDIVALLSQALPAWAPRPTEEEIDFLTRQFENLDPGAALSFNPSMLGREKFDPALHLDVEVLLESCPNDAKEQGGCNGVTPHPLLARNHPGRHIGKEVLSGHGDEALDLRQQQISLQHGAQRGRKDASSAKPPKESIAAEPLAPPPPRKFAPGGGDRTSNRSDHDNLSIKEALRRLKVQVKAVERLRSCIQHDRSDGSAGPGVPGCDEPVRTRHLPRSAAG